MTKTNFKHRRFSSIITLLLAFMLTAILAFATACDDGNDSSDSSSSSSSSSTTATKADEHTLLNGNFEYYAEADDTVFPYKTSIKWSTSRTYKGTSATSSAANSGIIDVTDKGFEALQAVAYTDSADTSKSKLGDFLTVNPKSPSTLGLTDVVDEEAPVEDSDRVLMIHNRVKGTDNIGKGTAQYFYSSGSTLTLNAGEYGKLTVWVNTQGLNSQMLTNDYGAFVRVVNKVGSTESNDLYVKSINTNGNWAKVEIYLEAGELASSSYTVYLGLGIGNDKIKAEYAEGFAFFDDVTFEKINEDEYVAGEKTVTAFGEEKGALVFNDNTKTESVSLCGTVYSDDEAKQPTVKQYSISHKVDLASTAFGGLTVSEKEFLKNSFYTNTDEGKEHLANAKNDDKIAIASVSAIKAILSDESFLGKAEDKDGEEVDVTLFEDTDEFLYFDYTTTPSAYTVTLNDVTVAADAKTLVSFWSKVAINDGATGLTINLRDRGATAAAIDEDYYKSTAISSNLVKTEENNGWTKYSIIIDNSKKAVNKTTGIEEENSVERAYDIEITFGPDTLSANYTAFPKGYALVGAFEQYALGEDFNTSLLSVNSTVTLSAEIANVASESNDTYTLTGRKEELEAGVLSQPTSGLNPYYVAKDEGASEKPQNSGVFNTEYAKGEDNNKQFVINGVNVVNADGTPVIELQNEKNTHVQALAIGDKTGYYTDTTTVAANGLAKVTVKYTTLGEGVAVINLLDRTKAPENAKFETLTLDAADINTSKETYYGDTLAEGEKITFTYTKQAAVAGQWMTATFYVAAGTEAIDLGVEVLNQEGLGLVVVDYVTVSTSETATVATIKKGLTDKGVEESAITAKTFSYKTFSYDQNNEDTKVEEDGEYVYTVTEDLGLTLKYEGEEEYVLYANFTATNYTDSIYVEVTDEDEETDSSTSSSESASGEEQEMPGVETWLQITSIVVAAVLIAALLAVVIRLLIKKYHVKKVKTSNYYDRDARDRANERIRANKAKRALEEAEEAEDETIEEAEEEVEEYDYDEASSIEEEAEATEAEEQAEEAPAEEAAENAEAPAEEAPETPVEEEKKDNE